MLDDRVEGVGVDAHVVGRERLDHEPIELTGEDDSPVAAVAELIEVIDTEPQRT